MSPTANRESSSYRTMLWGDANGNTGFMPTTHYKLYQSFASQASVRSFNEMPLEKVRRRQGATRIPRDEHCTRREEPITAGLEQGAAKTLRG